MQAKVDSKGRARGTALRVAMAAMIVALCLVVSLLPSLPGPITKFGGFPLLLGGLLVGPRTGFAVGCLTDLIGFALRPTGPFFPGFMLTQALTAALPGLLAWKRNPLTWRPDDDPFPATAKELLRAYFILFFIFALTQYLTSVLMVSYFRSQFVAHTPFWMEYVPRLVAQATHVPVYAFLAVAVLKGLAQTDLFIRLLKARR